MIFALINYNLASSKSAVNSFLNNQLFQLVALLNCVYATFIVFWLTIRFRKPGMSGDLKREIQFRYVEYIVLYAIFDWPTCAITQPFYSYDSSLQAFMAGTKYIGG